MYEKITYELLVDRMKGRISNALDKREGSIIDTALKPAAAEMQIMYIGMDHLLNEVFMNEQTSRESLIKRAGEIGMSPNPATAAVLKAVMRPDTVDVKVGERFNLGAFNYKVTEKLEPGSYRMECESVGAAVNSNLGIMIPIDHIPGLASAELMEVLKEGTDEESTEAFLSRYLIKLRMPSTSGNKYDYYNWAMEVAGVGAAKVFPLADGPGTVKVAIADAGMSAAEPALVAAVAEHIEEKRPIGADVTVVSARERAVNVSAVIRMQDGRNLGTVQNAFQLLVEDFLHANAFGMSYVSAARIGKLLLETDGVEDYSELLLNGEDSNVVLADEDIAVVGSVTLALEVG